MTELLAADMRQRILYHQMLVSPHVGGGAKIAMEIHKHVVSTCGPVSQLFLPPGGEAERLARSNAFPFTHYCLERLTSRSRLRSAVENLRLASLAAFQGRGVVHVHSPFVYGAARSFFLLSRLRTVLHVHLDFKAEQLRWALQSPPNLVLVCAEFMRPAVEEGLGSGAARTTIRVIRNAVDTERFFPGDRAAAKTRLGLSASEPLLMMTANLAPHKGQETAIRAVAALRDQGYRVRLLLVGSERDECQNYRQRLNALCAELGVDDRVELAGFRSDIPELLQAADFVLLPSTSEGLPLSILEAQASKALVLAAPTAGIPEVIEDGRTGYLIPADDYQGYAERIASLLANPAEARAVVEHAYKYVRGHHDMGRYCNRVLQEYDALLQA